MKISKSRDKILLKLPSGEEKIFNIFSVMDQLQYIDQIDIVTRQMATSSEGFCENIYNDMVSNVIETDIYNYANALKIDYTGYGYAQYANIVLSKAFGAKNADIYISKALPMHCNTTIDLTEKKPIFWRGAGLPLKAKKSFYIVRVKTMFTIKSGNEPFIRYREQDYMRMGNDSKYGINDNHNFKDFDWVVLSTSDIYDKKTNSYYSKYIDSNGKITNATVFLTLGKDDFLLFKKKYDIRYLKILDGCYFI